jgi:hypothetical protein
VHKAVSQARLSDKLGVDGSRVVLRIRGIALRGRCARQRSKDEKRARTTPLQHSA